MSMNINLKRRQQNKENLSFIDKTLKESNLFLQHNLHNLQIQDYTYSPDEAIEELGLDSELINQLIEDYVSQILKSKILFLKHLDELESSVDNSKELDYTPLRELAHKNLGVARNLRIEDGIKILDELMKKDDLAYLILCVDGLAACAVRLKPKCAYQTIKLIDLKSSL